MMGVPELIYDEIRMVSAANVQMKDDVVFINLIENKVDIDNRYGQKETPMRNGMKLTPTEYKELISNYAFFGSYAKKWMNNVYFKNGIQMPYNPKEIYTSLAFKE